MVYQMFLLVCVYLRDNCGPSAAVHGVMTKEIIPELVIYSFIYYSSIHPSLP